MPPAFLYLVLVYIGFWTIIFRAFKLKMWRLEKKISPTLHKYSVYYQNLNKEEQKRFRKRVYDFIVLKKFYHTNKSKLTDEMKILIATSAVQITFGYTFACTFDVFRKIIISDKEYISPQTKQLHQGETNPRKSCIVFSWQHFMEGVKFPYDSINLGIHEFAHALFINNMVRGKHNQNFKEMMSDWHTEAEKVMQTPAARKFFRSYAFVSKMEFFACAMEVFFENPKAFSEQFPELYAIMCMQLRQNPLLANNGIAWERNFEG